MDLSPEAEQAFEEADREFQRSITVESLADEVDHYGRAMFAAGAAFGAAQRQRQDAEMCRLVAAVSSSSLAASLSTLCAERIEQEPTKP